MFWMATWAGSIWWLPVFAGVMCLISGIAMGHEAFLAWREWREWRDEVRNVSVEKPE
jgi:hypothetical protein